MIDYNVSGGDSGVKVKTYDVVPIGSSTRSTKNLFVWYTAVEDGEIKIKAATIAPGKTHNCNNVVKNSLMFIMGPNQDLQPSSTIALGNGSFAGYISVDKTVYGLQPYDAYSEFVVS